MNLVLINPVWDLTPVHDWFWDQDVIPIIDTSKQR